MRGPHGPRTTSNICSTLTICRTSQSDHPDCIGFLVCELVFVRPLDFRDCAPPLEKLKKGTGYLGRVPKDPFLENFNTVFLTYICNFWRSKEFFQRGCTVRSIFHPLIIDYLSKVAFSTRYSLGSVWTPKPSSVTVFCISILGLIPYIFCMYKTSQNINK